MIMATSQQVQSQKCSQFHAWYSHNVKIQVSTPEYAPVRGPETLLKGQVGPKKFKLQADIGLVQNLILELYSVGLGARTRLSVYLSWSTIPI